MLLVMFTIIIPRATFAGALAVYGVQKIFFVLIGAFPSFRCHSVDFASVQTTIVPRNIEFPGNSPSGAYRDRTGDLRPAKFAGHPPLAAVPAEIGQIGDLRGPCGDIGSPFVAVRRFHRVSIAARPCR
jgi:hypothetical protein